MKPGTPVGKLARRLQVSPTLKTSRVLHRRSDPPGQHGRRKGRKKSVFGEQLIEKQKLRFQFMVSEKAVRRAFADAKRKPGKTGELLIELLDRRLDATVFRSGIVRSPRAAQQLICHGHVFVNGKKLDRSSYSVKATDEISLSEKSMKFPFIMEGLREANPVTYIRLDKETAKFQRSGEATRADIPVICDEQQIVEWYSR